MLDREKVVTVLKRRFPGSTAGQIAAAANALVGLDDEWAELWLPPNAAAKLCRDGCCLQQAFGGHEIKVLYRIIMQ